MKSTKPDAANTKALALLHEAKQHLDAILTEEPMRDDISMEVDAEVNAAIRAIDSALQLLDPKSAESPEPVAELSNAELPTRQQGQFLAFIREYMLHSQTGIAPSHVDLQRYFSSTPPSVNSMLIRLEQRGFIRRIPRKARAIEIMIDPKLIPELDRPFKFGKGSRIL